MLQPTAGRRYVTFPGFGTICSDERCPQPLQEPRSCPRRPGLCLARTGEISKGDRASEAVRKAIEEMIAALAAVTSAAAAGAG